MSNAMLNSDSGSNILQNFTGILQEKFPNINFNDVPGIPGGDSDGTTTSTNFAVFMFSLIFGMFWITYITFFNSRVVGAIVTKIANRFVNDGYLKVG